MKRFKIILLISCIHFSGCHYISNDAADIFNMEIDTFLIKEKSVGKLKIGMSFKKVKEIYKNFDFETDSAFIYGFDGEGTGTLIKKNETDYLFCVGDESDEKVRFIVCLNSKYHTKSGIRPGIDAKKLKSVYPGIRIVKSMENDSESAFLEDSKVSCIFEYDPNKPVGVYANPMEDSPETDNFRDDARIYSIMVY
ncbi:MAG: hypothetical protein U0W24_09660 [Bacteroidales bacterium]